MIYVIYIFSMVYCLIKLYKRSTQTSLDGVIGTTPGLDMVMVLLLAPLLMIVDVSITWFRKYQEAEEARRRNDKRIL
jgi:hypothetical protein